MCAPNLGSVPEIQEPLALGLCLASVRCFPGPGRCRLGVPASAHTSVTSGLHAWAWGFGLSDGIRIVARLALCHLSDRMHGASYSLAGSFPTWHQKGTWGDMPWPWPGVLGQLNLPSTELTPSQEKLSSLTRPWRKGFPNGLGELSPGLVTVGIFSSKSKPKPSCYGWSQFLSHL